jgi:hypothetical protein
MKTIRQLLEENYVSFKKKAFLILRGHDPFSTFHPEECEDLAHRVVLDFFVSDSLNYTYDETKGNLEGYFVSYTRLRIRSLRREFNKQLKTLSLTPQMAGLPLVNSGEFFYEMINCYKSMLFSMKRKSFKTTKGWIPYSFVWHIAIMQKLQEGRVTNVHLERTLKVSKPLARSMYIKLWEFVDGKRAEGLF